MAEAAEGGGSEVLLEFRAGRMVMEGTRVKPDTRRGLIRFVKSPEMLLHLQWLDRSNAMRVEEDQIIFPNEAFFEKVSQSSSRVYLLRFLHDDRKLFFWMQEPDAANDPDICQQVNRLLTDVAWEEEEDDDAEMVLEGGEDDDDNDEDVEEEEEEKCERRDGQNIVSSGGADGMSSLPTASAPISQSPSLPAPVQPVPSSLPPLTTAPAAPPPAAAAAAASSQPTPAPSALLSDLSSILSGLGQIAVPPNVHSDLLSARINPGPSLAQLLRPEVMLPLLSQPSVQNSLAQHLPPELRSEASMRDLIQSPQFLQQLEAFSQMLQRGQIDLNQFGIDPRKYGYSASSFLEAIQDQVAREGGLKAPIEGGEGGAEAEKKASSSSQNEEEKLQSSSEDATIGEPKKQGEGGASKH